MNWGGAIWPLGGLKMPGLKFDWSINLGHVLMLAGTVAAFIGAYATYRVTINDMETRLRILEKWQLEQNAINSDLTRTLYAVRQDVAVIRDRIERHPWQPK